ncbi:MAG: CpcT/CpeT family chromophore lyase, partial [Planctomycetota bacterium]|nr:CpcT/CpeT family chromophore lyase [Planctomycetota bacterium]
MKHLAVSIVVLAGCRSPQAAARPDLALLTERMTGTFSSREQAVADPDNFRAIRLVMLPIWTQRGDGPWLYVEQAAEDALGRPYRQRVYRLVVLADK